IYWPIFLMALGEPLPKQVFGHPWLLVGDGKMSKSLGNVIYADDLVRLFGVDAVRYYVLHEMPFANDGVLSYELICERINSDLANVLGNLVNRTIAMTKKYFGGIVPAPTAPEALDDELKAVALGLPAAVEKKMDTLHVADAIDEVFARCAAPTSISTRPCRGRSPRTRASRRVWARCCTICSKRSALPLLN
ncbi:MAG: class I tRNA ligase family protein, partial [Butyricicoccus sp.]